VKFLVDNQLPPALARWLAAGGHDAVHVLDRDLAMAEDRVVWLVAGEEERIVVSKDEDFFILAARPGEIGRLLWIRLGNCRKDTLLAALAESWAPIEEAELPGVSPSARSLAISSLSVSTLSSSWRFLLSMSLMVSRRRRKLPAIEICLTNSHFLNVRFLKLFYH